VISWLLSVVAKEELGIIVEATNFQKRVPVESKTREGEEGEVGTMRPGRRKGGEKL